MSTEAKANEFLNNVPAAMREKFTDDEIKQAITIGKVMTQKAFTVLLGRMLEARGTPLAKELKARLEAEQEYNYCGYEEITFDVTDYKLRISVAVAPKDYMVDLGVPAGYESKILGTFVQIKELTGAAWLQFQKTSPEIYKGLCEVFNDIDMSILCVSREIPTLMYWDQNFPFRLTVFPMWVTRDGQPMLKKSTK